MDKKQKNFVPVNKINILNENIIKDIFITILSFFSIKHIHFCRSVSKSWYDILISKLAINMLFLVNTPSKIIYERIDNFDFHMLDISKINNNIFISACHEKNSLIYNFNRKIFIENKNNLSKISSNSKFICGVSDDYKIKFFDFEFNELTSLGLGHFSNLTIDENYIYTIETNSCYIYDFKGKQIYK